MRVILPIALAWLALNLYLLAGRGFERIGLDAQIRKAEDTATKRSLCWHRKSETEQKELEAKRFAENVRKFEIELRKLIELEPDLEHLVVWSQPTATVSPSIARHLTFPATVQVVAARPDWLAALEREERTAGLKPSVDGGWKIVRPGDRP